MTLTTPKAPASPPDGDSYQVALGATEEHVAAVKREFGDNAKNGHLAAFMLGLAYREQPEGRGLRETLEWYGEQARLARLIHSGGDAGRHALAEDGGKRARAALSSPPSDEPAKLREAEALGWAKSRAWHHYGIAWGHLERKSRDELLTEALAALKDTA